PASSPLRAQLWFDTHALGIPVVLTGLANAATVAFLVALIAIADGNPSAQEALAAIGFGASLGPLIIAGRRLLGLRRKQGNIHLGSFDGTRPIGSARLVGIRVVVTTAALLVAWTAVIV